MGSRHKGTYTGAALFPAEKRRSDPSRPNPSLGAHRARVDAGRRPRDNGTGLIRPVGGCTAATTSPIKLHRARSELVAQTVDNCARLVRSKLRHHLWARADAFERDRNDTTRAGAYELVASAEMSIQTDARAGWMRTRALWTRTGPADNPARWLRWCVARALKRATGRGDPYFVEWGGYPQELVDAWIQEFVAGFQGDSDDL